MKQIYISGSASKKEKDKIKKQIELSLYHHKRSYSKKDKEFFKKYEIKKTKKEIEIIKGVNKITNDVIKKLGCVSYDIPLDNIHFLSDKRYFELKKKGKDSSDGFVDYDHQRIVIRKNYFRKKSLTYLAHVLFHEMLHLKGIFEIRFYKTKNRSNHFLFRNGISFLFPYNKENENSGIYERFFGLHEAIISYQEKRSHQDILNLPQLKKEKEYLESKEYQKLKKKKSKETGCPKDEIIYINKKNDKNWSCYCSYWLRKLLEYIMEEIEKEFPEYKNKEDIFEEFLKAQFKRNHFKKLIKLVEETFGKFIFHILGNAISNEIRNLFLYKNTFEIFRKHQLREKRLRKKK